MEMLPNNCCNPHFLCCIATIISYDFQLISNTEPHVVKFKQYTIDFILAEVLGSMWLN